MLSALTSSGELRWKDGSQVLSQQQVLRHLLTVAQNSIYRSENTHKHKHKHTNSVQIPVHIISTSTGFYSLLWTSEVSMSNGETRARIQVAGPQSWEEPVLASILFFFFFSYPSVLFSPP